MPANMGFNSAFKGLMSLVYQQSVHQIEPLRLLTKDEQKIMFGRLNKY